jgi:hypothetical protein
MSIPASLHTICEKLRSGQWSDQALTELVDSFVAESEGDSQRRLGWLGMFAARRALPCWELYCDSDHPIQTVDTVQHWLVTGESPESWAPFTQYVAPRFRGQRIVDCRECDASCAAGAATASARFASTGDVSDVITALIEADDAFDQSPLGAKDEFRRWLVEVAVPAAWESRELLPNEQRAFRDFDENSIRLHRETHSD